MTDSSARHYEGREFEAAAKLDNYYRWITEVFGPCLNGAGLEVGAGVGNYSNYIRPSLSSLDLLEPSGTQASALSEKFGDDDAVRVFSATIDEYAVNVPPSSLDVICMVNVLEHIEDDVQALRTLKSLLKDGGHICIFVPALPFLYSELDRIFGHFRRYTKRGLGKVAADAGLEIVTIKYMDVAGIFAWGLINTLGGSTNLNPRAMQVYDRVVVPLTRGAEAVIPAPLGKSLALVARKSTPLPSA